MLSSSLSGPDGRRARVDSFTRDPPSCPFYSHTRYASAHPPTSGWSKLASTSRERVPRAAATKQGSLNAQSLQQLQPARDGIYSVHGPRADGQHRDAPRSHLRMTSVRHLEGGQPLQPRGVLQLPQARVANRQMRWRMDRAGTSRWGAMRERVRRRERRAASGFTPP